MKSALKEAVCLLVVVILVMVSVSSCIKLDDMMTAPGTPSPEPTTYEEFLWSLPPELLANVGDSLGEEIAALEGQIKALEDKIKLGVEIQRQKYAEQGIYLDGATEETHG